MTMSPLPPSSRPNESSAPASPPAPRAHTRRRLTLGGLANVVGYGLLALFALDVAFVLATYRPFEPEADAQLVMQLVERAAIPLMAYVLIFCFEVPDPNRVEQTVRKLLSILSLWATLLYLGLALLAVSSGHRLYLLAEGELQRQAAERTQTLHQLESRLPAFNRVQLEFVFNELVRRPRALPQTDSVTPEIMGQQVRTAIPQIVDATTTATNLAAAQARRHQSLVTAKYAFGSLIAALLFFLAWEATFESRIFMIFSRSNDPTLRLEDRAVRFLDSIELVPDFDEYRWYRRAKRAWLDWRRRRRNGSAPRKPDRHDGA